MLTTTLNEIRKYSPCENGWKKLLKTLGKTQADNEPVPFDVILSSNGLADALWCLRTSEAGQKIAQRLAIRFVRETPIGDGKTVWDLLTDPRSRAAIETAEAYLRGEATQEQLRSATASASAAASAAASASARAAAHAADYASPADYAAHAADYASPADYAAHAAARAAAAAQANMFLEEVSKCS